MDNTQKAFVSKTGRAKYETYPNPEAKVVLVPLALYL
jgi:hypothetical protein